ncbi:MAG: hypothetical protein IKG03_00740 [Clostridiales bacterium]|nr:hypothetical protein [Clostridiales bacterium]
MISNNGSIKKRTVTDKISFVLLAAAICILATAWGITHNPDQDVYFLIDNGKYILNNHCLPETAYWLIKPDVPTIIQPWLCDVVNYLAYAAGGYTGTVILGIIFNLILLLCLFLYCRETLKSKEVGLNAAIFCWILLGAYQSTRPYSITISVTLLESILLCRFFSKEKHTAKETALFLGGIAAVSVFQANWQASNILYPILWILCYVPVIKAKRFRIDLYALAAIAVSAACSVLSPLGIRGPLFLTYVRGSLAKFDIYEINPPQFPSIYTAMQAIVIALVVYAAVKRKLTSAGFFLSAGCLAMSFMFMRCCWTLALPIGLLLANLDFTERSHKMMRWAYVAAGALTTLLIFRYNIEKNDDRELMLAVLPPPEEVTLYTDFNSGSYFIIEGYKVYYDARTDLYGEKIAGDKAFVDEAYATWSGNIDYGEFIAGYGFDWFAVTKDSYMEDYLKSTPGYEFVFENRRDNIVIYKQV